MARSGARKKVRAAKPAKSIRAVRKKAAKKKVSPAKSASTRARARSKGRTRPAKKPTAKARGSKRAAFKEVSPPLVRKKIPPLGTPIPAPEKPPPLLAESKTTTAALSILERGIKLIYHKEFKKARHEFESIATLYPGEAEIIARSRSYLQICAREEAAHKKATVSNDQLYTLGVMEHNRANYRAAILHFQQAMERSPNSDFIYYSLAASLALNNQHNEAIENLKKSIGLNEDNRIYAKNDPDFASLHMEREFAELVGLPLATSPESS